MSSPFVHGDPMNTSELKNAEPSTVSRKSTRIRMTVIGTVMLFAVIFGGLFCITGCSEKSAASTVKDLCDAGGEHRYGMWSEVQYISAAGTNTFLGIPVNLTKSQHRRCDKCGKEEWRYFQ